MHVFYTISAMAQSVQRTASTALTGKTMANQNAPSARPNTALTETDQHVQVCVCFEPKCPKDELLFNNYQSVRNHIQNALNAKIQTATGPWNAQCVMRGMLQKPMVLVAQVTCMHSFGN